MEFGKYYNVTEKVNQMVNDNKLCGYSENNYKGVFICMDTHVFWVARILKGYNSDYETQDDCWLIERNKIDKYELIQYVEKDNADIATRQERDYFIKNCMSLKDIIENLLLMDDEKCLENWDNYECDSYDEAVNVLDDGFGIIEYKEEQAVS